jgi:hypothetical protein
VIHTGTHLLDGVQGTGMDDIFLEARAAGIKSVFSGGDNNYQVYTTPDYHQSLSSITDEAVVNYAVMQLTTNHTRLIRVHLQRIRDDWGGAAATTNASSTYLQHLIRNDLAIGTLIQALKDAGVWDSTYFVLGSDHGMDMTNSSTHVPSVAASWNNFLIFYGPGLKKGATIPYAELPDVPVTAARWLGLAPLKGHTMPGITLAVKGPTGVYLSNLNAGAPADLPSHPMYIDKYLKGTSFPPSTDDFPPYRDAMIQLIH